MADIFRKSALDKLSSPEQLDRQIKLISPSFWIAVLGGGIILVVALIWSVIEVNNVTFAYDPDEPPVINDLSLHIRPGEYIGIVGTSGCGKSTLLKLLLGFEKPQTGSCDATVITA